MTLEPMNGLAMGLDILALVYAALVFLSAQFWLIIHVGHTWWRRLGARSLWVALPLWGGAGAAIFLLRHRLLAERLGRHGLTLAAWIEYQTRRELGLRRPAPA